jgi:hypothetical protein
MSNSIPGQLSPSVDAHVFLVGRPPINEFLGFIAQLAVDGASIPQRLLAEEWRAANDHLKVLEASEKGFADNPKIQDIPRSQNALAQAVFADPIFQRAFQIVPAGLGIVELDRLVVFQKYINLNYVKTLQNTLGKNPTDDAVFRYCLPVDHPAPPVRMLQMAQNSYTFISSSNDFRFLEGRLFRPQDIANAPAHVVSAMLGLSVGYGANFVTVASVENRLILMNGSHRAFALRDMGITHAPCVIQRASRREELEAILQNEVTQKPDLYLTAPRPPLLKDYFDPALRKEVPVIRKDRLVRLSFVVEQFDIPAS